MKDILTQAESIVCNRCKGEGFIMGFAHVNQGRCFSCNGKGSIPKPRKATIKYSLAFISQYGIKYADKNKMTCVHRLSAEHPTASLWLLTDGENMYIAQPDCQNYEEGLRCDYAVPTSIYPEFKHYYNIYSNSQHLRWCQYHPDAINHNILP